MTAAGRGAFARIALLAMFLGPHPGHATSVSFPGMPYQPGRPLPADTLDAAIVTDAIWLKRTLDQNLDLSRRLPSVKFQVIGHVDGDECRGGEACEALAHRRAALFQAALVQSGAPTTRFCAPKAAGTPWPSGYSPTEEDRAIARTAYIDPIFGECP